MVAGLNLFSTLPCIGSHAVLGEMGKLGDDAERLHARRRLPAAKRPSMLICVAKRPGG
ncbi:MAG: hypothetical protein ACLTKG_03300 [Collinsella intestinalis]